MAQKILVVDDEQNIRDLATLYLEKEGFEVEGVSNGLDALKRVKASMPALIILDLMMPGMDGFEVCREVRREYDVPIVMLTARNEDVDKIVGLELGADDYVTKPFNPRELVARVKAILRRAESGKRPEKSLRLGNLGVDKAGRTVSINDTQVRLRTKEFDLLVALAESPEVVFTRQQLLDSVWGYDYAGETRTVDVHVQHLRAKIADADVQIETVRGIGYKLTSAEV